jgi:exoribonuclease II
MGYRDIDNLDHDPKLAETIGNLVVAWARAETALLNVFACTMTIHFNLATAAFYRIPTFEARTKVLLAILESWSDPKYDPQKIAEQVTKLNRLAKTRNDWVHGVWCVDEDNPKTVVFDFRAGEESGRRNKPVKAADVENHLTAVRARITALNELVPLYYYPPAP